MSDKHIVTIQVRMSATLKDDFESMCNDIEVSMSDKIREFIANSVRNHKRKFVKADERD